MEQEKKLKDLSIFSFGYDIKNVTKWHPRSGSDLRALIAMPNIPRPCHAQNPRNLLGASTWTHMRTACYAKAGYQCEICGRTKEEIPRHILHAHELYDIDYKKGTVTFLRCVCLCPLCHGYGIHTGRAITLYKEGNPYFSKESLLRGAENAFSLIAAYKQDHPKVGLRAYVTFLDYLKCKELYEPMKALIEKYGIKFYREDPRKTARWGEWKLIIGNREYPTSYKTEKDWEEAMKELRKKDYVRTAAVKGKKFTSLDDVEITDSTLEQIQVARVPEDF